MGFIYSKKGSTSVFLTMILLSFILAIGIFAEAASSKAARSYANAVLDLTGRSILSEFDQNLKSDYGIIGLFSDEKTVEQKFNWYARESFKTVNDKVNLFQLKLEESSIDLSSYALTNFESFEKQISSYMKYRIAIEGMSVLELLSELYSDNDIEQDNIDSRMERILKNNKVIKTLPSRQLGNQNDSLLDMLKLPNLNQLTDIDVENIYLNLYILKQFRHSLDSHVWKDTFFVNEIEYILSGRLSDKSNRNVVRGSLISLRTEINLTHIYSDSKKKEAIALAASLITPGPEEKATEIIIAGIWASAEAVNDLRRLENGDKVPLIKTANDWVLSLDNVLDNKIEDIEGDYGSEKGLTYENYLFLFLCFKSKETKLIRVMDLIQLNMQGNYNEDFLISQCYSGFSYNCSILKNRSFITDPIRKKGLFTGTHVY